MPTHVALLRGINVGGKKKVAMADLRTVVAELGHAAVSTYINSGNVLFTGAPGQDTAAIARAMTAAIAAKLGVSSEVVVLTRAELAKVIADNPVPHELDPKRVHAVFLSEAPGPELLSRIDAVVAAAAAKGGRDAVHVGERALYLHTPDGFGRSEVAEALMRILGAPKTGVIGTARNWATVNKLMDLCDG